MLQGQVAVVTGGSRGIGRAVCLALAEAGARVAVLYRSGADGARETAAACSAHTPGAGAWQLNVSREDQVAATVQAIIDRYGQIDVLVNNAATAHRTSHLSEVSLNQWNETLAVNLTGPFLMTRAVAPHMQARRQGRIVNIASVAGVRMPGIVGGDYSASKAGLVGFSLYCAGLLAPCGIRVNTVAPSYTASDMFDALGLDGVMPGQPADVAETVLWLCTPNAGGLNGECLFTTPRR